MEKGTFEALMKEAHDIAVFKGWYENEPTDGDIQCNLLSELFEAWNEFAHNHEITEIYFTQDANGMDKEDGVPVELADYAIRAFDALAFWNAYELIERGISLGDRSIREIESIVLDMKHMQFNTVLICISKMIVTSYGTEALVLGLIASVQFLHRWCEAHNIDMLSAVRRKMAYNKTRPYRHGGKRV